MKKIIKLLRQKNSYLKQFEKISTKEYHRLCLGDYSHINQFVLERQKLLNIMDQIDKELQESCLNIPTTQFNYQGEKPLKQKPTSNQLDLKKSKPKAISKQDKKTMLSLIQEKKKITLTVLQKDMLIHSYLNDTKYETAKDQIA